MTCPFCEYAPGEAFAEQGEVFAFHDKYPVTSGHTLIVPRRHVVSWFVATVKETTDLVLLLTQLWAELRDQDPAIEGFNVGINDGVTAGQTVMHAHLHLIPRRAGDMTDPAGGVRGVIPDKQKYERRNDA